MRFLCALLVASALADVCTNPNPCEDQNNQDIVYDATKTTCVPVTRQCFAPPCPQYDCLDCASTLCAAIQCEAEFQVQEGCCVTCRTPVVDPPADPCAGSNPCADSSNPGFDENKQICVPDPKACFTTPCPQYKCEGVCDSNPCIDPRAEGFEWDRPICVPSPKACFTEPCPQYECRPLTDCMVACAPPVCGFGERLDSCCGPCTPVNIACTKDLRVCNGESMARDPALNCEFPAKCKDETDPCENNPCTDSSRADYDALNTICVTDANSETNFRCTNICETVNPCIDPSTEGYDFDKPHCKPINVQCLVAPCPQFECEALDCSLVRCMQHECEEGTRKDTCCGPCRKVPEIMCAMDLVECADGSFVSRDPANGCAFPKCADETDVCDPNPCENQNNPDIVYDATKSMCVPQKKACFTTPCPQYACIEPVFCTEELKLCDDGETSVARDPMNGCEFAPCPASPCRPNPCLDQSHDGYDANKPVCNIDANGQPICEELRCLAVLCPMYKCSGNQHLETAPDECCARCTDDEVCDMSIKTCDDGSTVGRDGKNHCEFAPCPGEGMVCEMDAKICEDGSSVGRDPYNNCEFPDCPQPNPCDSNPCGVQRPMCVVDWDKGTYECQELNCAVVDCMAVFECEAGFHVETVGCCPQCVADNASPCSPNPCTSEAPYCIPAPKQCITIPCWQFECTTNDAQKGSTASASAVKLTPGGVAGVTVGTIAGAALLVVGALFLCRAQFTHKKGTTPLNSKQGSPEPSLRDSQATAPGVETGSVSVTVEGEPPSPQQAPVTQIVS